MSEFLRVQCINIVVFHFYGLISKHKGRPSHLKGHVMRIIRATEGDRYHENYYNVAHDFEFLPEVVEKKVAESSLDALLIGHMSSFLREVQEPDRQAFWIEVLLALQDEIRSKCFGVPRSTEQS